MSDTAERPRNKNLGEELSSGAAHAINTALLGLPEGYARGTGAGKVIQSILPQALNDMIEKAGGKQALLDTLERQGVGATVGDIAGSLVPGLGWGGKAAQGAKLLGKAANFGKQALAGTGLTLAQEAFGKDINPLDPENLKSAAVGGLAGAAGGAALGGALKGLKKPVKEMTEDIIEDANDSVLANVLGIRNAGMRKLTKYVTAGKNNVQAVKDTKATIADVAREYNITRPNDPNMEKLNADIQKAWSQLDATDTTLNSKLGEVMKLPEVMAVEAMEAAGRNVNAAGKPIDDIGTLLLGMAESTDAYGNVLEAPLKKTMDELGDATFALYKQASGMPQMGDKWFTGTYLGAQAKALNAVRNYLIDNAAMKAGQDPGKLRDLWKFKVLTEDAMMRAENNVGGAAIDANSKTGVIGALPSLFTGNIKPMVAAAVGGPVNKALTGGMNAMKGQASLVTPALVQSPVGQAALKAGQIGAKATNALSGARLGSLGAMEGATPVEWSDAGTQGTGAGPKPGPSGFGGSLETGAKSPEGYYANTLDSAVQTGMKQVFDAAYKGTLGPENGPLYQQYWKDFSDTIMENIHRGGHLDYAQAAKLMYPNQQDAQTEFTKSLNAFTNVQANIDKALGSSGLGGMAGRFLNPSSESAAAYEAAKTAFVDLMGGSPDQKQQFDLIMTMSNPQAAKAAILNRIKSANTHQAQLLKQAGVLK